MKNFNFQDLVYFQEWPWILSKQFTTKWVKILNVRNIVNWNLDISNTTTYISEDEAYWKYKHFLIDWDEIIIASSWIKVEYFDKKVCFANKENLPLMLNTSIIRLRSLDETVLLKWYLYYFLKSQIFKNQIQRLITWSAQLNFWPSHLKQIQIPLPPLSTQKQIIQKLDKLTELISLRKESIKKQEDLTKSIFIEMFGDPMINEKGWEVKKLWNIFELKYGKWLKSDNRTWKWYSVYWSNWLVWYHKDYLIKWKWIVVWRKWSIWKLILTQENFYPIDTTYFIEEKSNSYNLIFIFYLLSFLWLENMNKSAAIPWLNRNDVYSLSSIFPPISLQNKFASIVQKNEENIKKQKESLEKLEELYNGVMQESFKF